MVFAVIEGIARYVTRFAKMCMFHTSNFSTLATRTIL